MPASQMREWPRERPGAITDSSSLRTTEPSATHAARISTITSSASMPCARAACGKPSRTKSSGSL
jgi:hypothetical protein